MAKVFVRIELDTDEWEHFDDPMPLTITHTRGLSADSVNELLISALEGVNNPEYIVSRRVVPNE